MSNPNHHPFPLAMGTEEEKGLLVGLDGVYDEPYEIACNLPRLIPEEFLGRGQELFLKNGFKVYPGGSCDTSDLTNIELATPETAMPSELTKHSRAGEKLMLEMLKTYAKAKATDDGVAVDMRLHRRVVDSTGSSKACHDNYSVGAGLIAKKQLPSSMRTFLTSRALVVGAGHVTSEGYNFSQKMSGLSKVNDYGFFSSMYRNAIEQRLEIRCGDQNISDWATAMRVGSMALVIALNQSPYANVLNKTIDAMSDEEVMLRARTINRAKISSLGEFKLAPRHRAALAHLRVIAESSMDELPNYTDMPDEYFKLAKQLYDFCDDMESVGAGDNPLELLMDRADWASKLVSVQKQIDRDREFGIERKLGDYASQARDLSYDLTRITQSPNEEKPTVHVGLGFKLRDRGFLKGSVAEKDILKAYYNPPPTTRASVRGYIIGHFPTRGVNWGLVNLADSGAYQFVTLPDVDNNVVPDQAQRLLDKQKRYA